MNNSIINRLGFGTDGVSFIDRIFNDFNECTRLRLSVMRHKRFFDQTRQLSADRIYATNSNCRYCTANKTLPTFIKESPRP